jgi:hypothetical protein
MDLSVSSAQRRNTYYDDDPTPAPAGNGAAAPKPVSRGVDGHVDRAINDAVLFVGMNPDSAGTELGALRSATGGNVTAVLGHVGAKVDTKFGKFDLASPDQLHDFSVKLAAHYGLPAESGVQLEKALLATPAGGRDEMGRVALIMARAESGGAAMPSRIVLSGHSAGGEMWGDKTGSFELTSVCGLGKIFPAAAKQVEDIHFAGCFTTRELQTRQGEWWDAFPNLKTMWGYSEYSHLAPVGDLRTWEQLTRGRTSNINASAFSGHTNVNVWSIGGGLALANLAPADRAAAADADTRFSRYADGKLPVHDPHEAQVSADYTAYQKLAAAGDKTAAEKAETLLRVRFYEHSIRGEFAKAHGAELEQAFDAVGMTPPDFSKLSLEDAQRTALNFRAMAAMTPNVDVSSAVALLDGFTSLDPNSVPSEWCH